MQWLWSLNGVLVTSILSLLTFEGRAFGDFRYEYAKQDPAGDNMLLAYAFYLVVTAIWIWGLLATQRDSRAGLITLIAFSLIFNVLMGILTLVIFCPPGCTPWPLGMEWNALNLVTGLLAAISAGMALRSMKA